MNDLSSPPLPDTAYILALRSEREAVRDGTDKAYAALFASGEVSGLSAPDRALVALLCAALSGDKSLADHYRLLALDYGAAPALADRLMEGRWQDAGDDRLQVILDYAEILVNRPLEGDRDALDRLSAAGLSTIAIVTLSQLIAFLTYQVRLAAGLRLLATEAIAA